MKDAQQISNDLQSLTEQFKKAEQNLNIKINELKEIKFELAEKESDLCNKGKVKGRNEFERKAELMPHTKEIQKNIMKAELKMEEAKTEYHYIQNQLENYQILVKLITNSR